MPRIITPPDMEMDRTIPKVLIRNCPWTDDQICGFIGKLSEKEYDIYIYNDRMNDVQWVEGIRALTPSSFVLDGSDFNNADPVAIINLIDKAIPEPGKDPVRGSITGVSK
jgi:hypothetical protein